MKRKSLCYYVQYLWCRRWLGDKQSACQGDLRDVGLSPGSGRPLGGGNGNPLQYSCLENSMDRGAWWATFHGATKSWKQLSDTKHKQNEH